MDLYSYESLNAGRELEAYLDPVLLNDERILDNLLASEGKYIQFSDYFGSNFQLDLQPHMRNILTHWMVEVCDEQQCEKEVFPLAVNYLDRFLSVVIITRDKLQLLGAACMFVASKMKETRALSAETLVEHTDNSITVDQLVEFEKLVITKLTWILSALTPYDFIDQILHRLTISSLQASELRSNTRFLIALCTRDYTLAMKAPSLIAGITLFVSSRYLIRTPVSNMMEKLHAITKIDKELLISAHDLLIKVIEQQPNNSEE